MHTHGLWVSPSGNSDNVLISIKPEERFRYEYELPTDHPAGTFWYHPHAHGAGFVQVGSGMAGALIVTGNRLPTASSPGDIDILLRDERNRPLPERVMIIQQIEYGCFDDKGKIEGKWTEDTEPIRTTWVLPPMSRLAAIAFEALPPVTPMTLMSPSTRKVPLPMTPLLAL